MSNNIIYLLETLAIISSIVILIELFLNILESKKEYKDLNHKPTLGKIALPITTIMWLECILISSKYILYRLNLVLDMTKEIKIYKAKFVCDLTAICIVLILLILCNITKMLINERLKYLI